jgi:peptidoglycan/LPS O-acetylase OafA/YrhL
MLQFIYASQLPGTLDEFVFGICIAKLLHGGYLRLQPHSVLSAWAAAAAALLDASARPVSRPCLRHEYWKRSSASIVLWRPLACAGFACLLACLVMLPFDGGWVTRPFRYLGEISYGIYLWHIPVSVDPMLEKDAVARQYTCWPGTDGVHHVVLSCACLGMGLRGSWIGQSRH